MDKPTVLVCEDEVNVRKALGLVLEEDYTVVFAADGQEALKQFRAHPVDVVLLDLKIPNGDGMEILKTLMADRPPPKVIILTAYQSVEIAERVAQAGAVDYLTKPFDAQTVLQAIQKALSLPARKGPAAAS